MPRVIYLDHNATTPVDPRVLESMLPYFSEYFGNPSSSLHPQSWATAGAVKNARTQVANLIQAEISEIIFTSGATESTNFALKSLLNDRPELELITSNVEHSATFEVSLWAQNKGHKVNFLKVKPDGLIDLAELENYVSKDPENKLVSILLAHNEIGSLYNLNELSRLRQKYNFLLHLDATQALLTVDINSRTDGFDLMSFSAHKIYGPKGIGGLYLRKSSIGHYLTPLICGGGQEFGLRAGTLNVPGIVGFGAAAQLIQERKAFDRVHFQKLSNDFHSLLKNKKINVISNGHPTQRIYQNISLTLPGDLNGSLLLAHLKDFCISQGAACSSQKTITNPVLSAIGLNESQIKNTLRIGLGRNTLFEDLELFVDKLLNIV